MGYYKEKYGKNNFGYLAHLETLLMDLKNAMQNGVFGDIISPNRWDSQTNLRPALVFSIPHDVKSNSIDKQYCVVDEYLCQYPQIHDCLLFRAPPAEFNIFFGYKSHRNYLLEELLK